MVPVTPVASRHEGHSMYVSQLCNSNVVTVRPGDEITVAAQLMRERHVGYLVVVTADTAGMQVPIGVLTDRDIVVSIVARGIDPKGLTVGDVMTANPVTVYELDAIEKAVQEMRRIGVRRMPVIGKVGQLKGVLSIDDVLNAVSGELRDLAGAIRTEQRIESTLRT
jgi:CBS domain-containing protein